MEGVNEPNPIKKFSVLRKTLLNDLPLGSMTYVCGVTCKQGTMQRCQGLASGSSLSAQATGSTVFRTSLGPPYSFRGTLPTASWTFYPQLPMESPEPLDSISLRQHRNGLLPVLKAHGALGRKKMFLIILAKLLLKIVFLIILHVC